LVYSRFEFFKKGKLKIEKSILGLSKALFWDVDPQTVDPQKHSAFIVERVITLGTMEDFIIIKSHYGKSKIKRIVENLRYLNDRDLNFCSVYFNVPLNKFRCYTTRQLTQTLWDY
jgi:hypothetical protein